MSLSAAKQRALATASTADGMLAVLAIDHRDSLRVAMNPKAPDSVSAADVTAFKLDVIRELAPFASAVMLESEYSLPQAIETEALPGNVGFLAALESQGYLSDPAAGPTTFMDDFSAADAKRIGASAAKLLLHYNPRHEEHAEQQRAVVVEAVARCAAVDIPLFLEPMHFDVQNPDDYRSMVLGAVRDLGNLGADVLKMPFPIDPSIENEDLWIEACAELDDACPVPWALLSAGVPFQQFAGQLRVAAQAGCSGFMVGRALWREALAVSGEQRIQTLRELCRPRFLDLQQIAQRQQRSWNAPDDGESRLDMMRWFGVRSFFRHGEINRFEERVVLISALNADLAMEKGEVEAVGYADEYDTEFLGAVQGYEISADDFVSGPGLVDGLEVFSLMRDIEGSVEDYLATFTGE